MLNGDLIRGQAGYPPPPPRATLRAEECGGPPGSSAAATLRAGSAPGHVPEGRAQLPRASRPLPRAPHSRNPRGLALLPAGSTAAFPARPHAPTARRRRPAEQQPRCPEPRHDPEPHPAHRKSPTGKKPLAGDVVRKPQSREQRAKLSREAGPKRRPYACAGLLRSGRQKADGRSMLLRGQKETMPRENSGREERNKDQNFINTKKMQDSRTGQIPNYGNAHTSHNES
uniref:uncharacterized protein LOC118548750 n=1 Tax=Halichoerus grypus TaxID=9711 RepID=UPI001658CC3C|nr:uncharacterized protein LOC118548750 [Halichoerus grypus]